MGLFSFVKDAGEKLLGSDDADVAQAEAAARQARQRMQQARFQARLGSLDLAVDDLQLSVDSDTVTVGGRVADQATREKVLLALGNVAGVAAVDDRLEVEATEPPAAFYTVKKGDTLSKIAQAHYGKASAYHAIFEANQPLLKDPDHIYPGQVLRIPELG